MALLKFLLRQLTRKEIYFMFLATFTMALMFAWRAKLKNDIYWDI